MHFFEADIKYTLRGKRIISRCLKEYANKSGFEVGEVNYIFCSDEFLLGLNKRYLRHDYYTDILSFQNGKEPLEGDIYISIERVKENANTLNTGFLTELYRVISHGLLHFMSYKDNTKEESDIMRVKEEEIIQLIKNYTDMKY
ncbi:MAG: rRNA maturation RNase YbeY [Deltaproteobacteria bacterium]